MATGGNATNATNSRNETASASESSAGVNGEDSSATKFDCYPYTFSPLLLFAEADYFDKG